MHNAVSQAAVDPTAIASTKAPLLTREHVVDEIRQRIIREELVPGQRLIEADLCLWLNASRGNVRTALMDLEHEGLVERIANRGARVRIVPLEEALSIVEVRLAVETLCVVRAAERIEEPDIARLQAIAQSMKDSASQGDAEGYAQMTRTLFETYVAIADQPVAADMLIRLRARNTRHRFRLTFHKDRARVSLPYWLALIDAICARNPAGAREALRIQSENIVASMKAMAAGERPFASTFD